MLLKITAAGLLVYTDACQVARPLAFPLLELVQLPRYILTLGFALFFEKEK